MVRHNNILPNVHFHKQWQRRVKTWFSQPAKKTQRRLKRQQKAAQIFPRPVAGPLRPVVRGQTNRYNMKLRAGRGFTPEELKAAGIPKHFAPTVGIAVDHRRKNRSMEGFQENVLRLKEYKSKLVLFPKNTKKPKAGEATAEEMKAARQLKGEVMPVKQRKVVLKSRKLTEEDQKRHAYATLRKARADARLVGLRNKPKDE